MARRVQRQRRNGEVRRGPQIKLLDPDAQNRLLEAIKAGTPLVEAARHAGVHERSLHRTIARGEDAFVREDQGRPLNEDDRACLELWKKVKEARAQVAVRDVALMQKAAAGGYVVRTVTRDYTDANGRRVHEVVEDRAPVEWRAAAWLLERSFPQAFGRGAQQFEVFSHLKDGEGGDGSEPSLATITVMADRLVQHTRQAAADEDGILDAEVLDDELPDTADTDDDQP
jgi:hypothetical protein